MKKLFKFLLFLAYTVKQCSSVNNNKNNSDSTASQNATRYIFTNGTIIGSGEYLNGPITVSGATLDYTPSNLYNVPLEDIKFYNYIAGATYCSHQLIFLSCHFCQKFNTLSVFHHPIADKVYDQLALITTLPTRSEIVVGFRGTHSIINAIADAAKIPCSQPGVQEDIKVHEGFYLATMSIFGKVVSVLKQQLNLHPGYTVVLTGHSLGGALATMTLFFFKYLDQFPGVKMSLVTFGEPRSGNKVYADYLNKLEIPVVRVANVADPIPHLPPVSGLTLIRKDHYLHHLGELWITDKTGTTVRYCSDKVYEDPTCSNSIPYIYNVFDHAQYFDVNYLTCVLHPFEIFGFPEWHYLQQTNNETEIMAALSKSESEEI